MLGDGNSMEKEGDSGERKEVSMLGDGNSMEKGRHTGEGGVSMIEWKVDSSEERGSMVEEGTSWVGGPLPDWSEE